MKLKVVIVILAVACVGLGIALISAKKQAGEQHTTDVNSINDLSSQLVAASNHLDQLGQVNLSLSNDLASSHQQLTVSQQQVTLGGEQLTQLSNSLASAQAALAETKTSLASAQDQITSLNSHITDLQSRNKALDDQVDTLSNQLAELTVQIDNTRKQLAASENKDTFLQHELQKQLALKADLEHKFNDIVALRSQVKKIQDEMFVARHLELMKYDTGGKKGAELLVAHNNSARQSSSSKKLPSSAYDLNVEVGTDGSVRVIPPLGSTNNVAH